MSEAPLLFICDDELARRLRAVAGELRVVASRRRAHELAAELDRLATILEPREPSGTAS